MAKRGGRTGGRGEQEEGTGEWGEEEGRGEERRRGEEREEISSQVYIINFAHT